MHFFKYLPLAFTALAVAVPTSSTKAKPNADTIIADIGVIREKTNALHQTLALYQGGKGTLKQALEINEKGEEVAKAIKQAIKDAKAANPFTEEEAVNIGLATLDLNPDVISLLDTFKEKRQAFDNHYRFSPIVRNSLKDQKQITIDLRDAIKAKVPDNLKDAATEITQPVLNKFDEVIAVYSTK